MPSRFILPDEAFADFRVVLRLPNEKLETLCRFFDVTPEVSSESFEELRQKLGLPTDDTRACVTVASFLLQLGLRDAASELVNTVQESLLEKSDSTDRQELQSDLDRTRSFLERIATPSTSWKRARKIRSLEQGPETAFSSCRTICQLRPLFERSDAPESDENIAGLVATILFEIKFTDSDGDDAMIAFTLAPDDVDSVIEVLQRTKGKLAQIQKRHGKDILNLSE